MLPNERYCTNIVKCVGAISEIKFDFIKKQDNIYVNGVVSLNINNNFIKVWYNDSKYYGSVLNKRYYDLIEFLGVDYNVLSSIDKGEYTLNKLPIGCKISGKINVFNKDTLVNSIQLPNNQDKKIFCIGNLTEYGISTKYLSDVTGNDYIDVKLQGIVLSATKLSAKIMVIKDEYCLQMFNMKLQNEKLFDQIKSIQIGSLLDLNILYSTGYKIKGNVVDSTDYRGYVLLGINETGFVYDKKYIQSLLREEKIKQEAKANKKKSNKSDR